LWRWGLTAPYGLEQFTFGLALWPRLRAGRYQVLHVQDPWLARWCAGLRRRGLLSTREILAHGTEEPPEMLAGMDFVQHLAPWHLEQALAALGKGPAWARAPGRCWRVVPNMVNTDRFSPAGPRERRELRRRLGIPEEALVVGTAAAVKKRHKRLDYLVREAGAWLQAQPPHQAPGFLAVAGSETAETPELRAALRAVCPGRHLLLLNRSFAEMPDFYRCLDLLVLPSLFEMLGLAVLEAMACGVPVAVHRHPVLEWVAGPEEAGAALDLSAPGALAGFLCGLEGGWLAARGAGARRRARRVFSHQVVTRQCRALYREVWSA
jgi:glycosyltransferase involved in cell wall biosynthesis